MPKVGERATGAAPPAAAPVQVEDFDHNRLLADLDDALEAFALADADRRNLDRMEKVVLAEIFNSMEGAVAARESAARAHPIYKAHLVKLHEATQAANLLKAKCDGLTTRWETWRTLHGTYRAQMNLR